MMTTMGRPHAKLTLSDSERSELQRLARSRSTTVSISHRARIVLECATGLTDIEVAEELETSRITVGKWRRRFIERRLDGLFDEPRVGAPRKISDEDVERVIQMTLHQKPRQATHWSTRLLAKETGLSRDAIHRIWKAFSLKPHQTRTFSLSTDSQFIEKVRDVVGLYMRPPENALVLCVDEKSQIQALDRSQPALPMKPTTPHRMTHNYFRHGTTSLFAALDVASGNVIGKCFRHHRTDEFLKFLNIVKKSVPADLDVHLVMDNYVTHKNERVKKWLLRNTRFHIHFIPTHSSWLNMVESWFSLLSKRRLKRGVHCSTQALERDINDFLKVNNADPTPYVWKKDADQILADLKRYCEVAGS